MLLFLLMENWDSTLGFCLFPLLFVCISFVLLIILFLWFYNFPFTSTKPTHIPSLALFQICFSFIACYYMHIGVYMSLNIQIQPACSVYIRLPVFMFPDLIIWNWITSKCAPPWEYHSLLHQYSFKMCSYTKETAQCESLGTRV